MGRRVARPTDQRGFSIIELLIAVAIGGAGIAAASYVAKMAVRGAGRGSQVSQAVLSTQVIARQMRSDLELAGFGSTGAVGADPSFAAAMVNPTARPAGMGTGRNALPVIRGIDNAAGLTIGGVPVLQGSDILQVIVPDPGRASTTVQRVPVGTRCNAIVLNFLQPGANVGACTVAYVSDHTGANGAGRTQLLRCGATDDPLLFDIAPGADLMCARWSTYWVDNRFQLHRSDLDPALGTLSLMGGLLHVPAGGGALDVIAPGVVDLQVAYRLSSAAGPTTVATSWAYDEVSPTLIAGAQWFEVRQARVNLLFRTLRAVDDQANGQDMPVMENRPAGGALSLPTVISAIRVNGTSHAYRFVRMTTSQVLHNQRFFDLNLPTGVPADPY